ncbi:PEP-CTERM sorting domain-containing protein [Pannus brasiliensis CCIBt3594]|uniref:PEP-CTERM sorting domain-containing protein n=1 Tax=Pannus brasiliensis CCIBt3594 TaxID=1427578 RepID=A0AAW9R0Z8_9CHRO
MLKITRNLTYNSLTMGVVLAGLALVSPEANASTLLSVFRTTPITVDNIRVTWLSDTGLEDRDRVDLLKFSDLEYLFHYSARGALKTSGDLSYKIEILDPSYYFSGVQLDSNTSRLYQSVKKDVHGLLSLNSVNGKPDFFGDFSNIFGQFTSLNIKNSFTPGPNGKLLSTSNQFLLAPRTPVPEPGTVLGLLALGGIGFISRFPKQK